MVITGYFIYCTCRKVMGRTRVKLESFLGNSDKPFYEMMADLMKKDSFTAKEIQDYISVNYNKNPKAFQPYELLSEEYKKTYEKWKSEQSTVGKYLQFVKKSFDIIENICLKENLTLEQYKKKYALNHIKDGIIDGSVAVYLKLVDRNKLTRINKILLKKFLADYNVIQHRIKQPELKTLLKDRTEEMLSLITEMYNQQDKKKVIQSKPSKPSKISIQV